LFKKYTRLFILIVGSVFVISASAEELFKTYKDEKSKKRTQAAYDNLLEINDGKLEQADKANKYFALGINALELKLYKVAREHLTKALDFQHENKAHIFYLMAHNFKKETLFDEATTFFHKALDNNPPQNISYSTRFELSEIAIAKNKYDKANEYLNYLERRWRGTPKYPEVVWRLMDVEFKRNNRTKACRWARKLFTSYPGHPVVKDWGYDLRKNKFEGGELGCVASIADHKNRIRKLQLYGQAEKARSEIDEIRKESIGTQKYDSDLLLVAFLESSGFPEDALQIMTPYLKSHATNFNFQYLLAKVSARAGDYPMAIGAYYKAYRLSPRSKSGREALFSSAFLSYQTQDYDGAHRRFSEFINKFSTSGLARDSKWHLVWLKYLRGDYAGAEKGYEKLLAEKVRVRRRQWSAPYNNDRTKYWLAMSMIRQGKNESARLILKELAQDPSLGYYAIVAKNRLAQIPELKEFRGVANIRKDSGEMMFLPIELTSSSNANSIFGFRGEMEKTDEESESEENLGVTVENSPEVVVENEQKDVVENASPELMIAEDEVSTAESGVQDEKIQLTTFRDPKLQVKFLRAQNLIRIGEYEWAKWELYDIESRTRNKAYLKNLMELYSSIGSYHRASYISEIYFSTERVRGGFNNARDIWSYNFPLAYGDDVKKASRTFGVEEAMILSITKAESSFYPDAVSPVGAQGLMQIMTYTAAHLTRLLGEKPVDEQKLREPATNIRLGVRYLSRLQKKLNDQLPLVAAGYNAGPHRVNSWLRNFGTLEMDEFIEHVPFVETRNYMKKVMRNYAIYNQLYNSKNTSLDFLTSRVSARPRSEISARENWDTND
jgi:soluble lytic murein transglycosylase